MLRPYCLYKSRCGRPLSIRACCFFAAILRKPVANLSSFLYSHVLVYSLRVRTEMCAFSEMRVYPGHGIRLIRRDGQPVLLGSSKVKSLLKQGKKPGKLMWTQTWRRLNKKGKDDGGARKKRVKKTVVARAISGVSVDVLKSMRKVGVAKPKNAATEAALKEVKEKKKQAAAANRSGAPRGGANVPKLQAKHK